MSELENIYHLIVQEFPSRGIRALLVGGHAVNAHGYTRATQDIDFIIDSDQEELVSNVMKSHGYTNESRHETVLFCMKPEAALRIDFLKTDSSTMNTLWEKRNRLTLEKDAVVFYADIKHLIAMKLTALKGNFSRREHKDLPDILNLAQIHGLSFETDLQPLLQKFGTPELETKIKQSWELFSS